MVTTRTHRERPVQSVNQRSDKAKRLSPWNPFFHRKWRVQFSSILTHFSREWWEAHQQRWSRSCDDRDATWIPQQCPVLRKPTSSISSWKPSWGQSKKEQWSNPLREIEQTLRIQNERKRGRDQLEPSRRRRDQPEPSRQDVRRIIEAKRLLHQTCQEVQASRTGSTPYATNGRSVSSWVEEVSSQYKQPTPGPIKKNPLQDLESILDKQSVIHERWSDICPRVKEVGFLRQVTINTWNMNAQLMSIVRKEK